MRLFIDLKKLFYNRKKIKTLKFLNSLHNSNLAKYPNIAIFANDKIGAEVSVHGIYEKNLILFLQKYLLKIIDTKNSIAIDVGANIGNHAIFFF